MNQEDALKRLKRILQSQEINLDQDTATMQECIEEAVDKYSTDKPIEIVVDLAGNGTQVLDFPSTFTYDFSAINSVEYPVDDTVSDKSYLEAGEEFTLYRKPDGTLQLLLIDATPENSSDPVRASFTQYVDSVSDVLTHHQKAVIQLSAYFACLREAQKTANTTADGEGLDFVETATSSTRFSTLAEKFKTNYDNIIFGDPEAAKAAGETVAAGYEGQLNTVSRFNEPRIFHKDDE